MNGFSHGRKHGKSCPECAMHVGYEDIRCPYCGTVLMDEVIDMDDEELEEWVEHLQKHGRDDELEYY